MEEPYLLKESNCKSIKRMAHERNCLVSNKETEGEKVEWENKDFESEWNHWLQLLLVEYLFPAFLPAFARLFFFSPMKSQEGNALHLVNKWGSNSCLLFHKYQVHLFFFFL